MAAIYNEDIAIDDSDAVLGLFSTSGGSYGSAITLGEIAEGALTNKWSIFRTTGASSRLTFSFGSDPSYAANAAILRRIAVDEKRWLDLAFASDGDRDEHDDRAGHGQGAGACR